MSSGSDQERAPKFTYDSAVEDDEMKHHWSEVAKLLRDRVERAKASHQKDMGSKRKTDLYLKRALEFYSFTSLVRRFRQMVKEEQEIAASLPIVEKADLN